MKTRHATLAASLVLTVAVGSAVSAPPQTDPTIPKCLVSAKAEVEVPAEDAGVLIEIKASEGTAVRDGDVLFRIDDTEPQLQRKLAEYELNAAKAQAENDVNIRYAKKQAQVSEAELNEKTAANKRAPDAVPVTQIRQLRLQLQRSLLAIEQAAEDQTLAKMTAAARQAELEAANVRIKRRQVRARMDGQVVDELKNVGEWVNPGDTVLRIVRLNQLRVDGFLNASEYDPHEIDKRPVTIEVELARGRKVQLKGRVVHVSPLVEAAGDYPIVAEVENRLENGHWLLQDGRTASMTIHVATQTAATKAKRPSAKANASGAVSAGK